jgi:hypothetical protein
MVVGGAWIYQEPHAQRLFTFRILSRSDSENISQISLYGPCSLPLGDCTRWIAGGGALVSFGLNK